MKSTIGKVTLLAFLTLGVFSCKNNENTTPSIVEDTAEASETALSYQVDTEESVVRWEGKKPTATHFGTVTLASGELMVNEDKVEAGNFTIDMTKISVGDLEGDEKEYLEAHLKGLLEGKEGDFFDTTQYPSALFELVDTDGKTVKGNLTIKDQTHTVEFPAEVSVTDETITITSEEFDLDRTQWGINFMSRSVFTDLGDKFVNDTMKISVHIVAKRA